MLLRSGGCGDLTPTRKLDRTIELNLYIAGVCEEAHDGSALLTRSYDLPSDVVSLGINVGSYVDEFTCNDAILNDPVINETLVPLSGRLELEVTPDGEANAWMFPSMVSATLRDAVFVDGTLQLYVELRLDRRLCRLVSGALRREGALYRHRQHPYRNSLRPKFTRDSAELATGPRR